MKIYLPIIYHNNDYKIMKLLPPSFIPVNRNYLIDNIAVIKRHYLNTEGQINIVVHEFDFPRAGAILSGNLTEGFNLSQPFEDIDEAFEVMEDDHDTYFMRFDELDMQHLEVLINIGSNTIKELVEKI
jgi:hypothetical protein